VIGAPESAAELRSDTGDWTDDLEVFCADVGSLARGNFAWARRRLDTENQELHEPESIQALATAVADELEHERPVALGFEAPLFVPVPEEAGLLGKARPCDLGLPSWSSGPGASVMATGLVQLAWVLSAIRRRNVDAPVHVDWDVFARSRSGLLLWEAFVSGSAKGQSHEDDARIGVNAFCAQLPYPGDPTALAVERPMSLTAAAALWAGWAVELAQLHSSGVLVRA
jgi:hypothetical protein